MEGQETLEKPSKPDRIESIKNWLKHPTNLILVAILIFAIVIRFYYFWLTKTQPLWWDEAAYGSLAKNYISHAWDGTNIIAGESRIRPPMLPILWSFLLRFNFSEVAVKFFLILLPSILSVFFLYLTVKETYSKQAALISTFMFSVLWIHLFYTGRLLTNVPALAFMFLSIYFFLRSTSENFKPKLFALSLILLGIGTLMRYPVGITFIAYFMFLIITKQSKLIQNKSFWLSGIIGTSPILLFFLYNYTSKGNIFPALLGGGAAETAQKSIAFHVLNLIPLYLSSAFFILFVLGLLIAVIELMLGYDIISKDKKLRGHLLLLLIFLLIFGYFIFYIRAAEDRWLFPAAISLVAFSGLGLDYIATKAKKFSKYLGIIIIIVILLYGANAQLKQADPLIKDRKDSFIQQKQGFEWIRDNTSPDSVIAGQGVQVYAVYIAERQYKVIPDTQEEMQNLEADFLVVHIFSGQPDWINEFLQENQDKWQPINGYFLDAENTQPAFIIYKYQP